MKCELCQHADAQTAIRMTVEGESRELYVCQACASRQNQPFMANAEIMVEILFQPAFPSETPDLTASVGPTSACPSCGMTRREFRKRSWLGCATCYDHFKLALIPLLRDMHRGARHVGKVPRRALASAKCEQLEIELTQAVAQQQFEQAAHLRDAIKQLGQTDKSRPSPPEEPHA